MAMKRQEHKVNDNGMSRLTYCLQIVEENPPTPLQHCQVEVWPLAVENIKIIPRTILFFVFFVVMPPHR